MSSKPGRKSAAELAIIPASLPEHVATSDRPEPPAHLSPDAATWWRDVVRDYDLEPHHLHLLQLACEAWDRKAQAAAELVAHGALTFTDPKGTIRAHPAVAMERDARTAFARMVRELDLDCGAPAETKRPPALSSNRRI